MTDEDKAELAIQAGYEVLASINAQIHAKAKTLPTALIFQCGYVSNQLEAIRKDPQFNHLLRGEARGILSTIASIIQINEKADSQ